MRQNLWAWKMGWVSIMLALSIGLAQESSARSPLRFRPPNRGAPPVTGGAATRGGVCITRGQRQQLQALVPSNNLMLTTQTQPTLFVHVPASTAKRLEVRLTPHNGSKVMYRASFSVPQTAGVVRLTFDRPVLASLPVNQPYRWSVALICDEVDRSGNATITGWLERTQLDTALSEKLAQANPQERLALYAEAGLWQETLMGLAELRQAQPQDRLLRSQWSSLLRSVRLETLEQAPLIDCCQPQLQARP